jgi:hypothetical protein
LQIPEFVQDIKDEFSMKQWIAFLVRTRAAAQKKIGNTQEVVEDTGAVQLSLQGFARRLEERKKKGFEGEYKGFLPPTEKGGDEEGSR